MNPLVKGATRPMARRILRAATTTSSSTSTVAAATSSTRLITARWQTNNASGPFDPIVKGELGVGELEGAKFRIEPLRRTGEDATTMRARLTYQSRKRGTLESDLLLSTFAAQHLSTMPIAQMREYDLLLDENDWDIYYWATQTEQEAAAAASPSSASSPAGATMQAAGMQNSEPYLGTQGQGVPEPSSSNSSNNGVASQQQGGGDSRKTGPVAPAKGEWAQTVGTFKPAYRPVPARWKDSEILGLLRAHVKERSAAGVLGNGRERETAEGMAFMPALGARK
ncbi:Flavinator of succinate dehydrogenase-domain-containing protein [Coniella lustricola]|uniref:Succinate dehydrogenase assembly factor 2, mitochondrial n=1 Tax=Coniella lustricola TaxID=2025994 RepID=A0A2T2ZS22_9PEZI|nr:Flavinator of succinate dehydrogenase-domain-containing protein [Coniella lustricola]